MMSTVVLACGSARYIERCWRRLGAEANHTGVRPELFIVGEQSEDKKPGILSILGREISSSEKLNRAWVCEDSLSKVSLFEKGGTSIHAGLPMIARFWPQEDDLEELWLNMTLIASDRTSPFTLLHGSEPKSVECST